MAERYSRTQINVTKQGTMTPQEFTIQAGMSLAIN